MQDALPPIPPSDEARRLARLQELFVLDSAPEPVFDSIVRLASESCGAPIAMLTLVDAHRQWFKSLVGLTGIDETPRDLSFCTHAIQADDVMEVPDATRDPRFADNPFVVGDPSIRFYAGAPLVLEGGERVGTLCVIDRTARQLDAKQAHLLKSLAEIATQALAMRRDSILKALSIRTQHEQALAASEAEYADLYANAPVGYHSLDAQGRFVRINETALQWMGSSRAEVLAPAHMEDFLTEEGRATFRRGFPRLIAEGRLDNIEFDLVGRNGVVRHLLASASVVRDAAGAFRMTRTVSHDVTELRRVKQAHEKLMAERNAILDTDLLGIVKLKDRHIAWCNSGMENLLGYAPGELAGQPTRMFYPDDTAWAQIAAESYPPLGAGAVFRTQRQLLRKDGTPIWVDLSATALPDSPTDPLCLIVDITALKREEEIRLRALELEAENRQLVEASRVKGVFLSNMSHELYTPLNAIVGYSHMLKTGAFSPDSPKFGRYLDQIADSGQHLFELIRTVLNFADAEAGRFDLDPAPVQLREVIRSVVDTQHAHARERGVVVVQQVDPAVDDVVIDELRLAQMISHYLSNAIKFSHRDGPVTVRALPEGPDRFRIEVGDRGIGIADQDVPKLFAPFRQLSEGRSKAYPGTGVSLALTRRLVEAHGGTFGVESRPGDGSTFWFVLPRMSARQAAGV